jgi:hypothetical protein
LDPGKAAAALLANSWDAIPVATINSDINHELHYSTLAQVISIAKTFFKASELTFQEPSRNQE